MVLNKIFHVRQEGLKNLWVGRDNGRLHAVTSRQVLRGYNGHCIAIYRTNKDNLGMVVGKVGGVDNLRNEHPQFERLVRGLVVENKVEASDQPGLLDEV